MALTTPEQLIQTGLSKGDMIDSISILLRGLNKKQLEAIQQLLIAMKES